MIASFFVIAHGTNSNQVRALADEVEYKLSLEGTLPYSKEGYSSSSWILLDYGDVIVHVFDAESRDFFKLEKLWSGAERIPFEKKEKNVSEQ